MNFNNLPTLIIAAAAVFISFQQWKLATFKYKHDLYEKRLAIYLSVERFIRSVEDNGTIVSKELSELATAIRSSIFLFKQEDYSYLETFFKTAIEFRQLELQRDEILERESHGDKTATQDDLNIMNQIHEKVEWYANQMPILTAKFSRYLNLV